LFPEGSKDIPLGTPIAIVVDNEKDVAAFANFKSGSVVEEKKETSTSKNTVEVKPAVSAFPEHIRLEMPNLSPTMEKVSLHHTYYVLGKH
jgi:pyruvate dehydrogenase E2 component (dihydrolipoamide acetyltransferase)